MRVTFRVTKIFIALLFLTQAQANEWTRVVGQDSPGVVITGESPECWFSLFWSSPTYYIESLASITVHILRFDVHGRPIEYSASGTGNGHPVQTHVYGGVYNTEGQATAFDEVRYYPESENTYSISISNVMYDGLGNVLDGYDVNVALPSEGPPTLQSVTDAGNATADVTWQPPVYTPQHHVGCAYDLYTEDWVDDFSDGGMWYLFGGTDQSGQMNLGRSGAYYLWINSSYDGGGFYPCDNPWVGVISSGQPHQPIDVTAQSLGNRQVKVSWKPDLYATWVYWLITYKNEDPNSGWIPVQGPLGDSTWHYTGYGVSEATLTMPHDGTYWVFLFAQGWNGQWSDAAPVFASP